MHIATKSAGNETNKRQKYHGYDDIKIYEMHWFTRVKQSQGKVNAKSCNKWWYQNILHALVHTSKASERNGICQVWHLKQALDSSLGLLKRPYSHSDRIYRTTHPTPEEQIVIRQMVRDSNTQVNLFSPVLTCSKFSAVGTKNNLPSAL